MLVRLKVVDERDLELLLAWAWIPEIWKYLPTSRGGEKLTWERHYEEWWKQRKFRIDWMILTGESSHLLRAVGHVHISNLDSSWPEVGLYVGEVSAWGRGIGTLALREVLRQESWVSGILGLRAVIHPKNKPSIKLFTKCGFTKKGKADSSRKGQDLYEFGLRAVVRSQSPVPEPQRRDRFSSVSSPM